MINGIAFMSIYWLVILLLGIANYLPTVMALVRQPHLLLTPLSSSSNYSNYDYTLRVFENIVTNEMLWESHDIEENGDQNLVFNSDGTNTSLLNLTPNDSQSLSNSIFVTTTKNSLLYSQTVAPSSSADEANCSDPLEHVDWTDLRIINSFAILLLINILVVAGNTLVIVAVFSSSKLRSVTNLFIVSLAVADMSLGIVVLPFSVTVEVFETWLFGPAFCSVWLAVDVWMSTASILNLVAISLDRYVAVTRPVSYPTIMTSLRAKMLIALVWVASFVVCFPPLVGWNDRHQTLAMSDASCHLTCELTNEVGYVLYSALGSFFVPMFIMMFFYYKIYCAAAETTRAINQGFKTLQDQKDGNARRFENERVTLRIHRGKHNSMKGSTQSSVGQYTAVRKTKSDTLKPQGVYEAPSSVEPESLELVSIENNRKTKTRLLKRQDSMAALAEPSRYQAPESNQSTPAVSGGSDTSGNEGSMQCNNGFVTATRTASKMGKRNIKVQVKRFRMETKAAKTLGIIVGVFILCWLPFFCMYVVRGFCPQCIPPLLFSIFFWLGYCNSAINPFIYALFSKEFRFAFKNILCKCICQKARKKVIRRAPTIYAPSYGEESDEGRPSH